VTKAKGLGRPDLAAYLCETITGLRPLKDTLV
jgi:hypothetical protein